ncbi:hypothetical protein MMC18_005806 [Xylographa bjoerkii]|nr:hypothetical protein [Xylographa bjoerkii]
MKRYGYSKLADILFASELQRRLNKQGVNVLSVSLNPGPVVTEGGLGVWPKVLVPILRMFFAAPAQGAMASLFAATDPGVRGRATTYKGKVDVTGSFALDSSPRFPIPTDIVSELEALRQRSPQPVWVANLPLNWITVFSNRTDLMEAFEDLQTLTTILAGSPTGPIWGDYMFVGVKVNPVMQKLLLVSPAINEPLPGPAICEAC